MTNSIYSMLFPWQKNIVDKFKDRSAFGLFLDMGLGKTPLSLGLAEINDCQKVIVVTINAKTLESIADEGSWPAWAIKSKMHWRQVFKDSQSQDADGNEIYIINYEYLFTRQKSSKNNMLRDNVEAFLKTCRGKNVALIVDESHKMKNLQSRQTTALFLLKRKLEAISNKTFTYLLTGTPFTNGYVDLYAQLKMLGFNGTKGWFVDEFCVRGNVPGLLGWQQPIVGYKNVDELFDLIHQFAITIKSEDVTSLPEQIFVNHRLPVSKDFDLFMSEKSTGDHIRCYGQQHLFANELSTDETFERLDAYRTSKKVNNPFYGDIAYDFSKQYPSSRWLAQTSGTFWLRARQLSIGFVGNDEEARWYDTRRLDQLETFLSENEDNYVLFYNFVPELLELYDRCSNLGYNIDVYCGQAKSLFFYERYARQTEAERLTNKKNIILANFASGSTGLNWQLYSKCIIFSTPVYKDYAQAIKRVHRTGQKNTVFYHIFSQLNWLDKGMTDALQKCIEYSKDMFESDLARVNSLTSDELNHL